MKISNFRFSIVAAVAFSLISCQQKKESKPIETSTSVAIVSLNLVSIFENNKQGKDTVITVSNDPVYHKSKQYNAVSAVELLQTASGFSKLDVSNTKVVFECRDGYQPEMPLELFLQSKPYIAFRDTDAPEGQEWETITKNGNQMDAAPYYLVYPEVSSKDDQYKWPYNLIKITLAPLDSNKEALYPKNDKKVVRGYQLFQNKCSTCHALNGIGGTMGPELNYPKSVTEYWIENQLVQYIVEPAAFRHNVKMPTLGLTINDSEEIVQYLKYISKYKKRNYTE